MTEYTFSALGLSARLQTTLAHAGYETPTPIQAQSIPLLLQGRDLLGIAQTGTGKTAAFTLPLLQKLHQDGGKAGPRQARALILAPTRELVVQICECIKTYSHSMKLRHTAVMGGVRPRPQVNAMRHGIDFLVATPGRLLDLINQRDIDLSATEYLVLDEADRMLDMGFIKDVRKIISTMPEKRQTLLFSATMPAAVSKFANDILNQPERVEITPKSIAVERIHQTVQHVSSQDKRQVLTGLLSDSELERVIVFTRTKHGADKVAKFLNRDGVEADALHGNKTQGARQRTLDSFRKGNTRVLVATDIASRGIDVDEVTHVINYEMPNEPESYVHRIGRTARAGSKGAAISLCAPDERNYLRSIEKLIKRPLNIVGEEPTDTVEPANQNRNRGRGKPGSGAPKRRRRQRRPFKKAA